MINLKKIIIKKEATIMEAMKAINRGAAEIALVVDSKGILIATITDGDIRRALLKGADLNDNVERYMQRNFVSVNENTKRAEVLDLMKSLAIKQIPIVSNKGKLKGLHLLREMIGSSDKKNVAVIMAGGKGERLKPITEKLPKPMVKVAGRPILERIILHLISYGVKNIYISINYLADKIEKHFLDGRNLGCNINYLKEKEPLGTAGSLSLLPFIPRNSIIVLNGDLLTEFDLDAMLKTHLEKKFALTVGIYDYVYDVPYGVIEEKNGVLVSFKEKPTIQLAINAGIYILEPKILKRIPKNKKISMPEVIKKSLDLKEKVGVFHIKEDWVDIGLHKDLKKAKGEI